MCLVEIQPYSLYKVLCGDAVVLKLHVQQVRREAYGYISKLAHQLLTFGNFKGIQVRWDCGF